MCQIWLPCSALYVTYAMYEPCEYCGIDCLCLPFYGVMADGEGHKGTRCICSFNSLCHTGCNTLYRTCHQYMLAHKRFTVQTWAECRCTHMSNMLQTIPRVHAICPSAAVCFMHPTYACGTPSTHLCARFPLRNTIVKITTRQSSIKITARPSLYPLPNKNTIKTWKPCCTQQNSASLASCITYKITTLIYRPPVGRLVKLPTGATKQ